MSNETAPGHDDPGVCDECGDALIAEVAFGRPYACDIDQPAFLTPDGPVWMYRKGQRVRFFDVRGEQVGPEQRNVAPALVYAAFEGWLDPSDIGLSVALNAGIRAQARIKTSEKT